MRVFARRGLGRGGHAEVAREASVAVPTVFAYYRTREDLVREVLGEVVRYYTETMGSHCLGPKPSPQALLDAAIAFAASVDSHNDYARVLLEWSAAVRDESWPLYLAFHDSMVQLFEGAIRRGQCEGTIPADLDANSAAMLIVGSAHLVVQLKFTRCPPEKVHRFLLTLLRGAIGPGAVAAALA